MSSPSKSAELKSNDPDTRQIPYSVMRAGGWDIYLILLNSSLLDLHKTKIQAKVLQGRIIKATPDVVFCRAGLADFYFAIPPGTNILRAIDFEGWSTITKIRTFGSKEKKDAVEISRMRLIALIFFVAGAWVGLILLVIVSMAFCYDLLRHFMSEIGFSHRA